MSQLSLSVLDLLSSRSPSPSSPPSLRSHRSPPMLEFLRFCALSQVPHALTIPSSPASNSFLQNLSVCPKRPQIRQKDPNLSSREYKTTPHASLSPYPESHHASHLGTSKDRETVTRVTQEEPVIIVGAGPSGLATAACLNLHSIPYIILEREDCSAPLWKKYAYDRLHLHLHKRICVLPHMPFPDSYPRFISKEQFTSYLDDYASHFKINPLYRRCVELAKFNEASKKWIVKARNLGSGEVEEFTGRFLAVASGETTNPHTPEIEGLKTFPGDVLHSTQFRNGKAFRDQKVLVVGSGNSGMEIALDLANHGAKTSIVVRSPLHILSMDMVDLGIILLNYIPVNVVDSLMVMLSKVVYRDLTKYGITRPEKGPFASGKYPILDLGTYNKIKSWEIEEKREKEMDGERNGLKVKAPFHSGSRRIDVDGLRPPNNQGVEDDLYIKLWHACAGRPSVYVPRAGEKVFYFPQGHMEQLQKYMNQDGTMEMPVYNLPSKILCRVLHVQLKAEPGTDEVFAQITLLPEAEQDERSVEHRNYQALPRESYSGLFWKKLTRSDTSTHGSCSIPRRHADDGCLPTLDMSQETPQQELVAIDLHGFEWRFRHIFRGQPKRHLLTSGWSTFVTSKKLVAEDTFIFLRGENGELRVGVRRQMTPLNNTSTSLISGPSMLHGILASAFHAFSTRSMFVVYYHPWTSSSEFIIPLDLYMRSAEIDYCTGTRFRMQFEGEECREQRALGTIICTEDADHIRWPNSDWRCLKVKWDPTAGAILRPERVCPWNIDPIEYTNRKKPLIMLQRKRAHPDGASSSGFSSLLMNGMWHGSAKHESQSSSGVFQGQENSDTDANQSDAPRQQLTHFLPLNPGWASMKQQMENQLEIQIPTSNSFYQGTSSRALVSGGKVASFGLQYYWPPTFSFYRVHEDALASSKISVPNVNSHKWRTLELNNVNETSVCEPNAGHRNMLFGVNLVNGPLELPSPQVLSSSQHENLGSVPPTSQSSVAEPSKDTSSKQCNSCSAVSDQRRTKVLKYGTALGRSVDLTQFDGYEGLVRQLDRMFDFNGGLIDGSSGWLVTYTDDEGDMMLIGDYPWQKLQDEVRRMLICPKEEMGRMNPSSRNSTSH